MTGVLCRLVGMPVELVRAVRDLRRPYSHRCPVCLSHVGPNLGAHVHAEHTPAELAECYERMHRA